MNNADRPASPVPAHSRPPAHPHCHPVSVPAEYGLSKREYFAAMAFQGLLASCADKVQSPYSMANDAVACADALLAELEKQS